MTILFYYQNDPCPAVMRAGTGRTFEQRKRLVAHEGGVLLTSDGVFVYGKPIKECVLFHGEPPTLMRCDIPLEVIRNSARCKGKLPLTYIDETGSVKEGATGKVIFKA